MGSEMCIRDSQGAGGRYLIAIGPQVEVVEGPVVLFIVFKIRLLQRARRSRSIFSGASVHHRLKHHAPFDRKLIVLKALPDLIATQHTPIMGEKAQMASHIDAEDRDVMHRQVAGSPQDRAISPSTSARSGNDSSTASRPGKGFTRGPDIAVTTWEPRAFSSLAHWRASRWAGWLSAR